MNLSRVHAAAAPPGAAAAASNSGAPAGPVAAASQQVVVVLLADVAPRWRLWGWSRIVRGAGSLGGVAGLQFAKVLGSGFEGGFGLRPSASRQGVFAVFGSEARADDFIDRSPEVAAYRARSREFCVAKLRAWSCRGSWNGTSLAATVPPPLAGQSGQAGPVAALTRASIRPHKAWAFWRMAPAAQASLARAPGCRLAAGLGEAPLLRQATFSVWDSVQAMEAYARSGAHLDAIRASQRHGHFSESMFVRFIPVLLRGTWLGVHHG
jgi:heme-degrading monooxygenase HmoA